MRWTYCLWRAVDDLNFPRNGSINFSVASGELPRYAIFSSLSWIWLISSAWALTTEDETVPPRPLTKV